MKNNNLMLKALLIIFIILMLFSPVFILNLNVKLYEFTKEEPIGYDKTPNLGNQGDDIFKLIFGTNSGPTDLDPQNALDLSSFNVINQVCEGLFTYNLTDPKSSISQLIPTGLFSATAGFHMVL